MYSQPLIQTTFDIHFRIQICTPVSQVNGRRCDILMYLHCVWALQSTIKYSTVKIDTQIRVPIIEFYAEFLSLFSYAIPKITLPVTCACAPVWRQHSAITNFFNNCDKFVLIYPYSV